MTEDDAHQVRAVATGRLRVASTQSKQRIPWRIQTSWRKRMRMMRGDLESEHESEVSRESMSPWKRVLATTE